MPLHSPSPYPALQADGPSLAHRHGRTSPSRSQEGLLPWDPRGAVREDQGAPHQPQPGNACPRPRGWGPKVQNQGEPLGGRAGAPGRRLPSRSDGPSSGAVKLGDPILNLVSKEHVFPEYLHLLARQVQRDSLGNDIKRPFQLQELRTDPAQRVQNLPVALGPQAGREAGTASWERGRGGAHALPSLGMEGRPRLKDSGLGALGAGLAGRGAGRSWKLTFRAEKQPGAGLAQPGQSTVSLATCPPSPATPWLQGGGVVQGRSLPAGWGALGAPGKGLCGAGPSGPAALLPGARPGCPGRCPSLFCRKPPAASRQPRRAGPTLLPGWEAILRHRCDRPLHSSLP